MSAVFVSMPLVAVRYASRSPAAAALVRAEGSASEIAPLRLEGEPQAKSAKRIKGPGIRNKGDFIVVEP